MPCMPKDKPMLSKKRAFFSRVRMIQMPLFGFQVIHRCVRRCVPSLLQTLLFPLFRSEIFFPPPGSLGRSLFSHP